MALLPRLEAGVSAAEASAARVLRGLCRRALVGLGRDCDHFGPPLGLPVTITVEPHGSDGVRIVVDLRQPGDQLSPPDRDDERRAVIVEIDPLMLREAAVVGPGEAHRHIYHQITDAITDIVCTLVRIRLDRRLRGRASGWAA